MSFRESLHTAKKKFVKLMQGYDLDTMIALKESFQSNQFQWIKTSNPAKQGKLVEVRDVLPARNGRFIAVLSDGSQIDTDLVSSDLMMITDDQPALSLIEIQSLNYIPPISDEMEVSPDIPRELASEINGNLVQNIAPQSPNQPQSVQVIQQVPRQPTQVDTKDIFGMFALEDTDLSISVKIKLPSRNLLKMMYSNSNDKNDFLTKLATYINNNVTTDAIRDTMEKQLGGSVKKGKKDEL